MVLLNREPQGCETELRVARWRRWPWRRLGDQQQGPTHLLLSPLVDGNFVRDNTDTRRSSSMRVQQASQGGLGCDRCTPPAEPTGWR